MLTVVEARQLHVDLLAPRLRVADRREVMAAVGVRASKALQISYEVSTCAWAALRGHRPVAMFGAAADPDVLWGGQAWLLASPEMEKTPLASLRASRRYVAEMHKQYKTLSAWVDVRNAQSIRWLNWCGFQPLKVDYEYGYERRPFIYFARSQ